MKPVANILRSKPDQVIHTIEPSATMREALEKMAYHDIGALVVVDDAKIVGIVTERDYARKGALMGRDSRETPVRELMTSPVMYVSPQESNENCMALMTEHRLRHLPVLDDGRLVGVLSMRDLVRDIISEQQFVIEQLQHYITGGNG
ncbi:MAG TPA: CBS domain-containing protein [Burkholderiaceae bacterium]|jgi:CBS domain-containing protein|nr:CBS domain-containing protein [Burkholderiaceae bacterium]